MSKENKSKFALGLLLGAFIGALGALLLSNKQARQKLGDVLGVGSRADRAAEPRDHHRQPPR